MDSNLGAIWVSRLNVASTQNENFVMEHILSKKVKMGKEEKTQPQNNNKKPKPRHVFP